MIVLRLIFTFTVLITIPFPALHFDHCSSWGAAYAGIQPMAAGSPSLWGYLE